MSLTDEEVICGWMEPKPEPHTHGGTFRSGKGWWYWTGATWQPNVLTLDVLWGVEERLTEEQWERYYHQFVRYDNPVDPVRWSVTDRKYRWALHATSQQKVKALAEVLREAKE